MQLRAILAPVTAGLVATALTFSATARAEDEFDVTSSGGKVVVSAKGDWHINGTYPWKLKIGDKSVTGFVLTDSTATLTGAPVGTATLKGAVCAKDGSSCKGFSKDITISQ